MKIPDFTFDEETHTYKLDGRVLPNVTNVLEKNFGTRSYWSEWHANRGRAMHLAIHYMVKGCLDWNTVDDRIKSRLSAFQKFIKETGYKIKESEVKLFSRRYRFAGTIDLILQEKEDLILADIKSSIEPAGDLQLGGYSLLWNERRFGKVESFEKKSIKKAIAVELKENGNYNLRWVKDLKQSQRIFLSCLAVANWKNQNY